MNKRNEGYLWKRFSKLFPDRKTMTPETSCLVWGFECGNGWYYLIKNLLIDIEGMAEKNPDNFAGFQVAQIKEKFGGLRFYFHGYISPLTDNFQDDVLFRRITKAEEDSYKICEVCGEPGQLRRMPWMKTLCDKCYKKREAGFASMRSSRVK